MRRILAGLALALLIASPVMAAPQSLTITRSHWGISNIVEQESPDWIYPNNLFNLWQCTHDGTFEEYQAGGGVAHPDNCVHNPTLCVWDVDDNPAWEGWGYLNTGASASVSVCVIADDGNGKLGGWGGDAKTLDVMVYAPQNTLSVVVTDTRGHRWEPVPTVSGTGYQWVLCYTEGEPGPFAAIPDSNGGTGLLIDYTVTVTARRKTNAIRAVVQEWGIGWYRQLPSPCPYP